jgi:hypothetical protein
MDASQVRALVLRLIFVLVASLMIAAAGYGCGRAIDCSPGEHDGQCGLGTFIGMMAGVAGALVVLGVGWLLTIVALLRGKSAFDDGKTSQQV